MSEGDEKPDDVAEMLRVKACGWGLKRIALHLGCSRHTVKGVKNCTPGREEGPSNLRWLARTGLAALN